MIFFFAGISISAQTLRDVKVFIPPVLGEGNHGDSLFFYNQLTYEVIFQHHLVSRIQQGTDYTLRGMISQEGGEYIFHLDMLDSSTDEVLAQQQIIYLRRDDSVETYLSTIVFNMLSGIPAISEIDDWRDRWLFISGSFLWSPRLYRGFYLVDNKDYRLISHHNLGIGFEAEFHFHNFFSVSLGLQFTQDWIIINDDTYYRDLILEVPIAAKLVLKPLDHFMLEPYGGVAFNISLMEETKPSLFSVFCGFQLGVRAGPGMFFIDPRYVHDLNISYDGGNPYEFRYQRYTLQIGLGYKYGFFSKKK